MELSVDLKSGKMLASCKDNLSGDSVPVIDDISLNIASIINNTLKNYGFDKIEVIEKALNDKEYNIAYIEIEKQIRDTSFSFTKY